jgi:hypothetical protein
MDAKRQKIELRVTPRLKELVRAEAEKAGMTISGWILRSAMMDDTDDELARPRAEDAERVGDFMGIRGGIDGLGLLLRDIRGELTGIRTRLDGLAAIEKQLGYQGQRMAAIESRFVTLLETRLDGPKVNPSRAKPA